MRLSKAASRGLAPVLLALFALSPAAAMWDGVRWNMNAAEVLAAAQNSLRPGAGWGGRRVKPTRRPALALEDALEGERLLGGHRVRAVFWFDPEGRLWSVTEEPLEADGPAGEACAGLEAALAAQYGASDLVTEKGELRHRIWRDEPRKTRIHFRTSDGGDCAIEYRELRGPLDR
jgi:hypothetical protein